jgi:hypothetical protein
MMAQFKFDQVFKVLQAWGNQIITQIAQKLPNTRFKDKITASFIETDPILFRIAMPGYGLFIEYGRKPGSKMPPVEPIMQWAKDKNLPQFRNAKGQYISNFSRGFIIAKSIARDGIPARPFLHVIDDSINPLIEQLKEAYLIDLDTATRQSFEEGGAKVS